MTAEILNWTGHMLRARRKDLGRLKTRAVSLLAVACCRKFGA